MYPQKPKDFNTSDYYYPLSLVDFCNNRERITCTLLTAKQQLGLTFEQLGEQLGASKEWVAAVILGQASMNKEDAVKMTRLLCVEPYIAEILQQPPMRGSIDRKIPVDPLIYRFYEIIQVYGTTFKAIINEMFGDGIISAIDFEFHVDKKPDPDDPEGERIVITMDGKFLPYEKW